MNKLWCFGDSFTAGDGCKVFSIGTQPNTIQYRKFLNKKDDEHIKLFGDIIAEHFGLECINLGQSGAGNEKILDALLSNIHLIAKEDYVIFGVSYFQRFDIDGHNPLDFSSININSLLENPTNDDRITDSLSRKALMEIVINRASKKFEGRLLRQVKGITHILKQLSKNVYVWTNDHYLDEQQTGLFKLVDGYHTLSQFFNENNITSHTNKVVCDGHLSEIGHRILANDIITYFENEK
jgi:hypothetical protein